MAEPIKNRPLPQEDIGSDDADLLRVARERFNKALDYEIDNREEAQDDLEVLSGEQWPTAIKQQREQDKRPMVTVNRLPQFVHQVTGDMRQNRPSIKVRPADDAGDEEIADIYSGLIRHIEAASDASIAYHTAGEQAAQCGMGHFRINTEYCGDDTFDQDIRIRRIVDPFCVVWDPHAVEATRSDAQYCFVSEEMDIETFKARYPKATLESWDSRNEESFKGTTYGDWFMHETIRVAEYWTKHKEERVIALLEDGRVVDATDLDEESGGYLAADGSVLRAIRTRKSWRDRVEMRIINGNEVLEGPFKFPSRYIPIVPVIGEEIHIGNKCLRHGVIRFAKDPQRLYNYWRSAQTEFIALQPKAPFLVTAKNVTGFESVWKELNTRNFPYVPYTPDKDNGGIQPQREPPPMGSRAMAEEVLIADQDLKGTTGIYDAGLGNRSNEKSGIAIQRRQQESDTSTFAYIDNLARAIRYAGRVLVDLIPAVYDQERTVRILNENETTKSVTINQRVVAQDGSTTLINDITVGKYDVVVTTGPSYATKRIEAADSILQLIQAVPKVGEVVMDLLVKNMDWPGADEIAERLRKILPPGVAKPEDGEEPAPPPPPSPEQLKTAAEIDAKGREQARKDREAEAKIELTQAQADSERLDNFQKELQISMQTGEMQAQIEQMVAAALQRIMQEQAAPPPQLQAPAQPGGPPPGAPPEPPPQPQQPAAPAGF